MQQSSVVPAFTHEWLEQAGDDAFIPNLLKLITFNEELSVCAIKIDRKSSSLQVLLILLSVIIARQQAFIYQASDQILSPINMIRIIQDTKVQERCSCVSNLLVTSI